MKGGNTERNPTSESTDGTLLIGRGGVLSFGANNTNYNQNSVKSKNNFEN